MSKLVQRHIDYERREYAFLHLSDIHFGQEMGGELFINREIKRDLVSYLHDLAKARRDAGKGAIDAIIVTGDIAFSGKADQYREAAAWLGEIASAVGCGHTAVHVVPGNHDIDRSLVSPGVHDMIDKIVGNGQAALDAYMADDSDRARLYERFGEYRTFAAGYGCELDGEGGRAGSKDYSLTEGLSLRIIGMNSALVCRGRDEDKAPGRLFLGDKQRVLERHDGVEHIVLMHHPITWLADRDGVWQYFSTRARIFISGHEHTPCFNVEEVDGNGKVLRIDSGAIVPPLTEASYGYTFNIIEVKLCDGDAELSVTVQGHIWDGPTTAFCEDKGRFSGNHERTVVLPCPQFARTQSAPARAESTSQPTATPMMIALPKNVPGAESADVAPPSFPELRLRYFHNLTPLQRIEVLVGLKILPTDWSGSITPGLELAALEALVSMGRISELAQALDERTEGIA